MQRYNEEYPDFEDYMIDMKEESRRDHNWLLTSAFLLGSTMVLESLKPTGPQKRPVIIKPQHISDISETSFKQILKLDVDIEKYEYIYSKRELQMFKQLQEELRHHGRLEDSRTIENTAMRWTKQKNKLLSDFGAHVSKKQGSVDVYQVAEEQGFKILIPWVATGPNPCGDCLALDGELFSPEDFPPPQHFNCECNEPMADPILVL